MKGILKQRSVVESLKSEAMSTLSVRIRDAIRPWAERSPQRIALLDETGSWTFRELDLVVSETEKWLRELGVRSGDRVMIVGENCRAFVAILLAAAGLDAWPVLVNARVSERELGEIRLHSGARRVLYTTAGSSHAAQHAIRDRVVCGERDGLGSIGISALNENTDPEPLDRRIVERVAALIYTSGTTGLPKGVMLTHRNLLFMAAGSVQVRNVNSDDRIYGILPMSHAVGLSVVLLGSLISGASLFISSRFDPMSARVALEKNRLTLLFGTPAMFNQLLQYSKLRKISSLSFPSLRIITSSGAPLDPATKSAVEDLFGMVLHNGYGVTECSPTIALTRPEAPRSDISVGPIFPGVEVRFVGTDHVPVLAGQVGGIARAWAQHYEGILSRSRRDRRCYRFRGMVQYAGPRAFGRWKPVHCWADKGLDRAPRVQCVSS